MLRPWDEDAAQRLSSISMAETRSRNAIVGGERGFLLLDASSRVAGIFGKASLPAPLALES